MRIKRFIWKIFSLQKSELVFVIPLFFLYLLSGSFYAIGQIYCETIFLKAYGADGLSVFFVYNGIALILMGIIYNTLFMRMSLRKGYLLLVIFASCFIFSSFFIPGNYYSLVPFLLYMGNYLFTFFLDIHFFNYSFQFLTLRSSKRILPFLMGGGKLGGIAASLLIVAVFSRDIEGFGRIAWGINGAILIVPIFMLRFISRLKDHSVSEKGRKLVPDENYFDRLMRRMQVSYSSPIFTYSVLAVLVMSIANQISEYYFCKIFNSTFTTKNELAYFLSIYTFIADFVTLFFQVFIISRVIRTIGVKNSNLLYPAVFTAFIASCLFFPNLIIGILLRFYRKNLSLIIRTPVYNVIIGAAPRDRIAEVRSFISGIISPLGMISGGGMIMLISQGLIPVWGYILSLSIGGLYIACTMLQNSAYVQSLKDSLLSDRSNSEHDNLDYDEYAKILESDDFITENQEIVERLFNAFPSIQLMGRLITFYPKLSQRTREQIVNFVRTGTYAVKGDIIIFALQDVEPGIRSQALALLKEYPVSVRRELLKNYPNVRLLSEKFAIDTILKVLPSGNGEEDDELKKSRLERLCEDIIVNKIDPIELVIYSSVLPDRLTLPCFLDLAYRTRNIIFFKQVINRSGLLTRIEARKILYTFRDAPLKLIIRFIELSSSLQEIDKAFLLNNSENLSENEIKRIFHYDEKINKCLIKRLFKEKPYLMKANYLNYILTLNIKPKREMIEYINFQLIRILEVMEVRNSLAGFKAENYETGIIIKVISVFLGGEIEMHKHLILKAIAVLTGTNVDETYESNLLLKDKDLDNIILEYIESSDKRMRDIVYIFENENQSGEYIIVSPDMLGPQLLEVMTRLKYFIPASKDIIEFCIEKLAGVFGYSIDAASLEHSASEKEGGGEMLSFIEKIVILKENKLFAEIPIAELIHVARITKELKLPPRSTLIQEGTTGEQLFIIVDGEVEVFTRERSLAYLGAGDCIGELSIIDKEPRSASVATVKKTRILSIDRNDFLLTLKDNPALSINIMQVMAGRLREVIS